MIGFVVGHWGDTPIDLSWWGFATLFLLAALISTAGTPSTRKNNDDEKEGKR